METEIIIAIASTLSIIGVSVGVYVSKKRGRAKISEVESNEIIDALGGFDNIEGYEVKTSRVNIFVNDINNVDANAIKEVSNCGVATVNNKVQVILKDNSSNFVDYLKNLEKRG